MIYEIGGHEVSIVRATPGLAKSYYDLLMELYEDPNSYILVNYSKDPPQLESIVERSKNWNVHPHYMHFALYKDKVVGFAGSLLGPDYGPEVQPHIAEIYYGVSKGWRKTGLIYALLYTALSDINAKIVKATAYVENLPSINVLLKIGLRIIAVLEENDFHYMSGKMHDDYLFRGFRSDCLNRLPGLLEKHGISVIR
ncbi:TVG1470916 [Thermoplasma volcanium GSS1]|uniref:TVG1470916 protein n=1 Tax=Thermoplasma volcanium (strain ATCC 51530 / DSM 4299 / JCM 9571 / NBRC 15438 / GSS1) TaxID=273116 RepID=Q978J1_THEVO|nr:GNAT family protein [Thermoplasma volcanium]BAB60566.1 TVG1470916 [Thermoplasma volcanium GSS1]